MSEPVCIVVKGDGRTTVHWQRWGGDFYGQLLMMGPTLLKEYTREPHLAVKASAPSSRLVFQAALYDWAHSVVLLDEDAKVVLVNGLSDVPLQGCPGFQRVVFGFLRREWPGWDFRWAHRRYRSYIEYLGLEPDETTYLGSRGDLPASLEEVRKALDVLFEFFARPYTAQDYRAEITSPYWDSFFDLGEESVISVRFNDGRVRDYSAGLGIERVLSVGPHLLDVLADHPGTSLPSEVTAGGGVLIDVPARELVCWPPPRYSDQHTPPAYWSGWSARAHEDGLCGQIALSGRDPGISRLSYDDVTMLGAWLLGLSAQAPPSDRHVEPEYVRARLRGVTGDPEAVLRRPRNLDEWRNEPGVKWAMLARMTAMHSSASPRRGA